MAGGKFFIWFMQDDLNFILEYEDICRDAYLYGPVLMNKRGSNMEKKFHSCMNGFIPKLMLPTNCFVLTL